jgi:hypothetical protein
MLKIIECTANILACIVCPTKTGARAANTCFIGAGAVKSGFNGAGAA